MFARKKRSNPFVGPNTYSYEIEKPVTPHKAPFLTSAKNDHSYLNPDYCKSLIYGVRDDMKGTSMGTSPSNKAPRVLHDISPGAPVTNYAAKLPSCPGAFDNKDKKKLRKLFVCRVSYNIFGVGPSVPTENCKLGYYVDETGNIKPVPATGLDRTGGPAKYGSNMKKSVYDQKYKGIKMPTAPRHPPIPDLPGPADYYNGDPDFHRDPIGDKIREMARLKTYIPRYMEKLQLEKMSIPGPADFDRGKPICIQSPAIIPLPLVTGAKRFLDPEDFPGPADYTTVGPEYPLSKLEIPFSGAAKRFAPLKPACFSGPSDYKIPSPINEKLEKGKLYAIGQPPFGKAAKRVLTQAVNHPGPTDYNPHQFSHRDEKGKKPSCIFDSKTSRWPNKHPIKYEYLNLSDAYDFLLKDKTTSPVKIPFNVTSERKGYFDMLPTPSSVKYCYKPPLPSKGYYLPNARRFPEPKDSPGPGSYLIHPSHTASMYNAYRSFNLKLKEEAVKMAFRVHPKETYAMWMKERRKKRKLKWFYKEGKEYVHCVKDMKPYKM